MKQNIQEINTLLDMKRMKSELRATSLQNVILSAAIDQATTGIIITDPHLKDNPIIYANAYFSHLTGYSSEEVIGKNCRFMQGSGTDPADINKIRESILACESITIEILNYKKDQTEFWNELTINPVKNNLGVTTHFIGIQNNVTESKMMLDKLNASNMELAKAKKQVDAAMQARNQFFANVSHELRTPLNGIFGMIQLMGMTRLTEEQTEMLNTMHASSEQMISLVNNLLHIIGLQSVVTAMNETIFFVENIFNTLADQYKDKLMECSLTLLIRVEPNIKIPLLGDAEKIKLILEELLDNAIQFTSSGCIELIAESLPALEDEPHMLPMFLCVKDTGIGIREEDQSKLFHEFQPLEEGFTRNSNGPGLGLALVKLLAEIVEGQLIVESSEGQGSCFGIEIKCKMTE